MSREWETDDETEGRKPPPFVLFVLFEAALAPVSLILGALLGQPPLETFDWHGRSALLGLAATLPMTLPLALMVRWPVGPFARIKSFFDRELVPTLRGCKWPDLAALSLAAGVGEEMLFRGVVQGALGRALGPVPGLLLAALLFGLFHPVSVTYVVVAGALGAYLGAVWLVTDNLLTVMVAHATYDFIALALLLREEKIGPG